MYVQHVAGGILELPLLTVAASTASQLLTGAQVSQHRGRKRSEDEGMMQG